MKLFCNALARYHGEASESLTPEEEEMAREESWEFVERGIPALRADPAWQSPEAQEELGQWERDTLRELGGEAGM